MSNTWFLSKENLTTFLSFSIKDLSCLNQDWVLLVKGRRYVWGRAVKRNAFAKTITFQNWEVIWKKSKWEMKAILEFT